MFNIIQKNLFKSIVIANKSRESYWIQYEFLDVVKKKQEHQKSLAKHFRYAIRHA